MALGDYTAGATLYKKFTTRDANVPATLSGSPVVKVYKDDSTSTEENTGVTLSVDFDAVTGFNHITIDTSADATFYANGHHYAVVITTGTVGGSSVVGETVWEFDLVAASASAPTAAQNATAVWQDAIAGDFTVSSSIGKSLYTSGAAPGSSGGLLKIGTSPLPASGTLAAGVWDEINTGATHNLANSTGKQLRSITSGTTDAIYPLTGTVNLTAATSTTATLDALASNGSQAYQWDVLNILSGTGAGQSRIITNYTTGRVATVSPAFTTTPDATSTFDITPTASVQVVSYIAGQDPATLTWAAATRTITGGTVATLTNLPAITTDWLSAAGLSAAAVAKIQLGLSTFAGGAVASVAGSVGSVAGNIGGNLLGSLTATERNAIADAALVRDWTSAGAPADRSTLQALRFLRNKWSVVTGVLTVTAEDDATSAWTSTISTDATARPIIGSDPV